MIHTIHQNNVRSTDQNFVFRKQHGMHHKKYLVGSKRHKYHIHMYAFTYITYVQTYACMPSPTSHIHKHTHIPYTYVCLHLQHTYMHPHVQTIHICMPSHTSQALNNLASNKSTISSSQTQTYKCTPLQYRAFKPRHTNAYHCTPRKPCIPYAKKSCKCRKCR